MLFRIILIFLLLPISVLAQVDTTNNQIPLNTELILATRNIWRGLDYGSSPTIQGTLGYSKKYFEVGTFGTTTLNGSKEGFGTWIELFATAYYKDFSLTIDDYFFFNSADSLNNYFEWNHKTTQHIIEARVKWDTEKFDLTAGIPVYKNENDNSNGLYLEAEYSPFENLSFLIGGLTGASNLSFYKSGGITTIGASGKRNVQVTEKFSFQLKVSLIANPSYEKSVNAPNVGTNPVYFVAYLIL
jgi:hypothetical protein